MLTIGVWHVAVHPRDAELQKLIMMLILVVVIIACHYSTCEEVNYVFNAHLQCQV